MTIEDKRFEELICAEKTMTLIKDAYWRLKPDEMNIFLKGILGYTDWHPIVSGVLNNAE